MFTGKIRPAPFSGAKWANFKVTGKKSEEVKKEEEKKIIFLYFLEWWYGQMSFVFTNLGPHLNTVFHKIKFLFSILSSRVSRNKRKLCHKLCHCLNWSALSPIFFKYKKKIKKYRKFHQFFLIWYHIIRTVFTDFSDLFSILSSRMSKQMCKMCQK